MNINRLVQFNPLLGLTFGRLEQHLQWGERGQYADLQWLYRFVEKRDPTVRAVKRRLIASLSGLTFHFKVNEGVDEKDPAAQKQIQALKDAYNLVGNLKEALIFLALADFRGFSHLEKIYEPDWSVRELRVVPQWYWVREPLGGDWGYNGDAVNWKRPEDDPIDPEHFIIREVDDAADEIFAIAKLRKTFANQDWDGFLERYGINPIFIEGPPNVPADKEAQYQALAEQIASDARGYLPNGSKIHTVSSPGGENVFTSRMKYLDEEIVIAATSGKLTVLNEATGIGGSQGRVHQDTFNELAAMQAAQVSELMQEEFDKPLLERLFPDEEILAYFEFAAIDEEDVQAHADNAVKLGQAGYAIDQEELSEKTGYNLKFVGAQQAGGQKSEVGSQTGATTPAATPTSDLRPLTSPSTPAPDPEQINTLLQNAGHQLAQAQSADLVPLRRLLETTMVNPTPAALQELLKQLAQVQDQLGTSAADVRAKALSSALATGLSS